MSIRTCPTCGTDVDVSNGLLGCPACGRSVADPPSPDEVPTSILQFFDDVEPDEHEVPGSRRVAEAATSATTAGAAGAAGRPGPDDTRELPQVVPSRPPAGPAAGSGSESPADSQIESHIQSHTEPQAEPKAAAQAEAGARAEARAAAPTAAPVRGLVFDDLAPAAASSGPLVAGGAGIGRLPGSRTRRRLPTGLLLVAAFALGGLAVLAAFALRGGSAPTSEASAPAPARSSTPAVSSPAPSAAPSTSAGTSADPTAVARDVEGLLVRSDQARGTLNSATGPLGTCRIDPAGAASTIQSVVDERRRILADLQGLSAAQVAALPSGDQLVAALASAMQASIAADQAYVQWADDAQGCTPGQAPPPQALRQGNDLSRSAQSAKSAFVRLWNPIAEKYGLPTRTADDV